MTIKLARPYRITPTRGRGLNIISKESPSWEDAEGAPSVFLISAIKEERESIAQEIEYWMRCLKFIDQPLKREMKQLVDVLRASGASKEERGAKDHE